MAVGPSSAPTPRHPAKCQGDTPAPSLLQSSACSRGCSGAPSQAEQLGRHQLLRWHPRTFLFLICQSDSVLEASQHPRKPAGESACLAVISEQNVSGTPWQCLCSDSAPAQEAELCPSGSWGQVARVRSPLSTLHPMLRIMHPK